MACLAGSDETSGATMLAYKASEQLRKVADYDNDIDDYYKRITDLYYELKSLESDIESTAESSDLDPERLYEVQSRLSEIQRICRKYYKRYITT